VNSESPTKVSDGEGSVSKQKRVSAGIHKEIYSHAKVLQNESACVLLIESVIQVEEEIRNSPYERCNRKWSRINKLLPSYMQGRTASRVMSYRCQYTFKYLLTYSPELNAGVVVQRSVKKPRSNCLGVLFRRVFTHIPL
jgi:hypothetical protein